MPCADNNGDKDAVNGSDTFDDWHEYEIDWKEDAITWSVDGEVKRTLTKESTWNETAKRYQYPQSPSRMQLSLWPAGQASNAPGTIEWAGGEIDWDSQDIKDKGYYYATFGEITVQCYDAPNGTVSNGNKSYMFTNKDGLQQSVQITNNDTVLASFGATGLDMDLGASDSSSSNGTNGTVPENQGGSGNVPGSSTSSGSSSTSSGFSQGSSTDTSGAPSQNERVMRGSFFAALVAVVVLVAF